MITSSFGANQFEMSEIFKHTILVVHDGGNTETSDFVRRMPHDIEVLESSTIERAYQLIASRPKISVVFLSTSIANLIDCDFVGDIRVRKPFTSFVLLSNYLNLATLKLTNLLHCDDVIQLPVDENDIKSIIASNVKNKILNIH